MFIQRLCEDSKKLHPFSRVAFGPDKVWVAKQSPYVAGVNSETSYLFVINQPQTPNPNPPHLPTTLLLLTLSLPPRAGQNAVQTNEGSREAICLRE